MKKGKGKKSGGDDGEPKGNFVPGYDGDSDELQRHLKPRKVTTSVNVPVGQWVDVPDGMTAAPGTFVGRDGYLRMVENGAPAVWHLPDRFYERIGKPSCRLRINDDNIDLIVFAVNGAPWCPDCYLESERDKETKRIAGIFLGSKTGGNN